MKCAERVLKIAPVGLALLAWLSLLAGCQSRPKPKGKAAEKSTKPVVHCLKTPEPTDTTMLVSQWKWHTSHIGSHDVNFFTFRFTPDSDEPCSYESVAALICERYVTSHTPSSTNCLFAGRQELMTTIVINADKIVRSGTSGPLSTYTSDCACPKH